MKNVIFSNKNLEKLCFLCGYVAMFLKKSIISKSIFPVQDPLKSS